MPLVQRWSTIYDAGPTPHQNRFKVSRPPGTHIKKYREQIPRKNIVCTWYTQCRPTHPIPVQWWTSVASHCCFNVGQSYSTPAQHWNKTGWLSGVCSADCHAVHWRFIPRKATTRITRYIGPIVKLGQATSAPLGQNYSNQNLLTHNHEFIREYIFFWRLFKQKCQPFPTHSTPLSPK